MFHAHGTHHIHIIFMTRATLLAWLTPCPIDHTLRSWLEAEDELNSATTSALTVAGPAGCLAATMSMRVDAREALSGSEGHATCMHPHTVLYSTRSFVSPFVSARDVMRLCNTTVAGHIHHY